MLKTILNLDGVTELSNKQKKQLKGGIRQAKRTTCDQIGKQCCVRTDFTDGTTSDFCDFGQCCSNSNRCIYE